MLGFSQVLKPIKWQDLLEEGKNGRDAFPTGQCKDSFYRKKYFRVRCTLMPQCCMHLVGFLIGSLSRLYSMRLAGEIALVLAQRQTQRY